MTEHVPQPSPNAAAAGVCACMSLRKTTRAVTRNLRPLIELRLVSVSPGADRRQRAVELTERGHEAFATILSSWHEAQSQFVMGLGEGARGVALSGAERVAH